MTYHAGTDTITALATLVYAERPDWDEWIVRAVLSSHSLQVAGTDLAIAALRCARDRNMPGPKAIGWRGPHWEGLETKPPHLLTGPRCDVCGKLEAACYGERPGKDDDHQFTPASDPTSRYQGL